MHLSDGELVALVGALVSLLHALELAILQRVRQQTKRAPRRRTDPPEHRHSGADELEHLAVRPVEPTAGGNDKRVTTSSRGLNTPTKEADDG